MAKKNPASPKANPRDYAAKLSEIELAIEVAKKASAQAIAKAAEAPGKAIDAFHKLSEKLGNDLSELKEDFDVKSVEMKQQIKALEIEKAEADEALETKKEELATEILNLEKDHSIAVDDLQELYKKKIEGADYAFGKAIREKGEAASTKFLADRGLVAVKKVDLTDLQNYKMKSEDELNAKVNDAVAIAKADKDAEFKHVDEVKQLTHVNEVALLKQEIVGHAAIVGKLDGMLKHYSKKDEGLLQQVKEIVESAAKGVQNNISQNPSLK